MTVAFWDASALVPLCFPQPATVRSRRLWGDYGPAVVWWGTSVEIRSTFARLMRQREMTAEQLPAAFARLSLLRRSWREVLPAERVRELAEGFPEEYALRAGDAFQLAAALDWCNERPRNRPFVCFDRRLAQAVEEAGFKLISEY